MALMVRKGQTSTCISSNKSFVLIIKCRTLYALNILLCDYSIHLFRLNPPPSPVSFTSSPILHTTFPKFRVCGSWGMHVRVYVCVLNYCVHLELLICVWGDHEVPPYLRNFGKIDDFWDSKNKFFVCLHACFLECGPWNPPHSLVDSWYPDSFIAQPIYCQAN